MLARCDIQGYRSQSSIQRKDDAAQNRFLQRSSHVKRARGHSAPAGIARSACSRPSLAVELHTFKATIRRVVRNFIPAGSHGIFQQPASQAGKRLRELGIGIHTPATNCIMDTSKDRLGNQSVEQALLKQRKSTSASKTQGQARGQRQTQRHQRCRQRPSPGATQGDPHPDRPQVSQQMESNAPTQHI